MLNEEEFVEAFVEVKSQKRKLSKSELDKLRKAARVLFLKIDSNRNIGYVDWEDFSTFMIKNEVVLLSFRPRLMGRGCEQGRRFRTP